MKYIFFLLLLCSISTTGFAQENEIESSSVILDEDVVILNNKTRLKGNILAIRNKTLHMEIDGESHVVYLYKVRSMFFKGQKFGVKSNGKIVDVNAKNQLNKKATIKQGFYNISYLQRVQLSKS